MNTGERERDIKSPRWYRTDFQVYCCWNIVAVYVVVFAVVGHKTILTNSNQSTECCTCVCSVPCIQHATHNSTYNALLFYIQFIIHNYCTVVALLISKSHFEMEFQPFRFIQFSIMWFVMVILILILRCIKKDVFYLVYNTNVKLLIVVRNEWCSVSNSHFPIKIQLFVEYLRMDNSFWYFCLSVNR